MNNEALATSRRWLVRFHRQVLLVILLIGLIYSLAIHGIRLMDDLMTEAPELATEATLPSKKQLTTADFSLLFGQADDTKKNRNSDIPATNLNLTLRGALAGADPSSAIIQGNDGQDRMYQVGDTIAGGAVLESVFPQHVVINHNGRQQKLLFPQLRSDTGIKAHEAGQPASAAAPLPPGPLSKSDQTRSLDDQMEKIRRRVDGTENGQGN